MKKVTHILYFFLSGVLVFIICEVFIKNTKIAELSFAEYYDDIGKGLPKSGTYTYFNEGFGITSVNESRFIGSDISVEKPENTIRIALIGDSYVESIQIFERFYFGNIAMSTLNKKHLNKNFQILNFGRSGFNIGNMYAYQRLFVDKFKPDYVLYFISNNDLNCDYTFPPLLPVTTIIDDEINVSVNIDDEELYKYEKTKFLTQNSVVFNILNSCRRRINKGEFKETIFGKFYKKQNSKTLIKRDTKDTKKITGIPEGILANFDSNIIIVNKGRNSLTPEFLIACQKREINTWDLKEPLDLLKMNGVDPFYWKVTNKMGHWNVKAHKAIGDFIAKQINHLYLEDTKHQNHQLQ